MNMQRKPTTPGELLNEEFLKPMKMTQREFAHHVGCDIKVINRIVNGKSALTAEMAVRFSYALNTTIQFWLNAQQAVDIYEAMKRVKQKPKKIQQAS